MSPPELSKAIWVPSGDQAGCASFTVAVRVRRVSAEPSAWIVQRSPPRTNTIAPFRPGYAARVGAAPIAGSSRARAIRAPARMGAVYQPRAGSARAVARLAPVALLGAKTFQNYIGGEWVDAVSGETFESTSPATGDTIGVFPRSGPE